MEENKEKSEKSRAQIILEELKLKYPIFNDTKLNESDIIKKIIELNFDENKIKVYFDIDKIYQELEDDYAVSSFIEEEAFKHKIVELNCDKDRIIEWIENDLING